jgi:hypothetical protein
MKNKNKLAGERRITALLSRDVSLQQGAYMTIERQNQLAEKYRKTRLSEKKNK